MRNIKLTLQYDGTAYCGWQVQKNAVTVQETLEEAVRRVTGETLRVTGCGRTDAGVHAKRYIANFYTEASVPTERFPYALNANLPDDIVCLSAEECAKDFHAKNSAIAKRYVYHIYCAPFGDAFYTRYAWHYRYPLDVEAMRRAARAFVGTYDFEGFSSARRTVKTTVRTITALSVMQDGAHIVIDVTGNGFLYNMVRIIAGTLVFVGNGKINAEEMPDIIASKDRTRAGITAPPQGLFLTEVYYE